MYALLSGLYYAAAPAIALGGMALAFCIKKATGAVEHQIAMHVGGNLIQEQTADALEHNGIKPVGFLGFIAALTLLRHKETFKLGILRCIRFFAESTIGLVSGLFKIVTGPLSWPFMILSKGLFGGASRTISGAMEHRLRPTLGLNHVIPPERAVNLNMIRLDMIRKLEDFPSYLKEEDRDKVLNGRKAVIFSIEKTLRDNNFPIYDPKKISFTRVPDPKNISRRFKKNRHLH